MTSRFYQYLSALFVAAALMISGCGHEQLEGAHEDHAETGHEGHNHGPGEHVDAPDAIQTAGIDWCGEHSVPESECTKCNPALVASFKESGDWCAGHDLPESHCRLCNPQLTFPQEEAFRANLIELAENDIEVSLYFRPNASVCATDGAIIQFASAATAQRAGLSVQSVRQSQYESVVDAPAEIVFDETEATVVTSTVPALVSRWLVSPGDVVRKGDVLALLDSPEIPQLKSDLAAALAEYEVQRKEYERHLEMHERDLVSEADLDRQKALTERARADYMGARGLLLSAGLNDADLDAALKENSSPNRFALRAPSDGMVVERTAQLGELMGAGRAFATIANPSSMWIEARLTEEQLRHAAVGKRLVFSSDGKGIDRVGGEIIWVSRFLDPHTRTGTVRARVIDPDHRLHAGEFGRAHIVQSEDRQVCLVPQDAVQWEGCCNVVFVRETDDRYRPRKVHLIGSTGPFYQVGDGLQAGEEVVVDGAFLLKTELKKSSIGAGCCGLEPVG